MSTKYKIRSLVNGEHLVFARRGPWWRRWWQCVGTYNSELAAMSRVNDLVRMDNPKAVIKERAFYEDGTENHDGWL